MAFDELSMNFITVFFKRKFIYLYKYDCFFLFAASFACLGQRVIYFFGHRTPTEVQPHRIRHAVHSAFVRAFLNRWIQRGTYSAPAWTTTLQRRTQSSLSHWPTWQWWAEQWELEKSVSVSFPSRCLLFLASSPWPFLHRANRSVHWSNRKKAE